MNTRYRGLLQRNFSTFIRTLIQLNNDNLSGIKRDADRVQVLRTFKFSRVILNVQKERCSLSETEGGAMHAPEITTLHGEDAKYIESIPPSHVWALHCQVIAYTSAHTTGGPFLTNQIILPGFHSSITLPSPTTCIIEMRLSPPTSSGVTATLLWKVVWALLLKVG